MCIIRRGCPGGGWYSAFTASLQCFHFNSCQDLPHLPWSEARGHRQRLPGISCTMPQGHASSSSTLPTQAPTNLIEGPGLLGTAQASAPCQYLLRCNACRCFQQCGDRSSSSAAAATSSSTILPLSVRQQPQGTRVPLEGLILPRG